MYFTCVYVSAVNDGSLINIINTPNGPGFGKLLMVQYVKVRLVSQLLIRVSVRLA